MSENKRLFHPAVFNKTAEMYPSLSSEDKKLISSVYNDILFALDNDGSLCLPDPVGYVNLFEDAGYIRDYCAISLFSSVSGKHDSKPHLDSCKFNQDDFLRFALNIFFEEYPEKLSLRGGHFFVTPDTDKSITVRNIPLWSVNYLINGYDDDLSSFQKDLIDNWKRRHHIKNLCLSRKTLIHTFLSCIRFQKQNIFRSGKIRFIKSLMILPWGYKEYVYILSK